MLIAQISDIHCGSGPLFLPDHLEQTILEVNEVQPDVVIISGDLTTHGYQPEYEEAREYIDRLDCGDIIVIPGNHDARNVGYVHFESMFGPRKSVLHKDSVSIVAVDSSEPDLDHGVVGRGLYDWIMEEFEKPANLRIFVLHHHLLPIPGTGRERNIVHDAGDALECLLEANVDLVLSGHKHVPYAWKLDGLYVVNAGTACTLRLRGRTKPCYNLVEVSSDRVAVHRKFPFQGRELLLEFEPGGQEYRKRTGDLEDQVGAPSAQG